MTYVASRVSLTLDGGPISNPDIGCYVQCFRTPLVICQANFRSILLSEKRE